MTEITQQRATAVRWGAGEIAVALVGLSWVVLAAVWAVPGVLIIDGFVYHAMIDAFARNGSLFVENGLSEYDSSALKLFLMRDVEGQLAPQYPGGWGILAAPAYLAGGLRGVILVNAVASALTLPLIWRTAWALFADRHVAVGAALIWGLATYAVDYAFGFWPHGITTFLVTAAVAAVATGWSGPREAELRGALVAGIALGIGVNIRVDALMPVAPLLGWLLMTGRRPYAAAALLLAGLAPGLVAAAVVNHAKFGIASPITYGASDGRASLAYYADLWPLAAVGAALALALGLDRVRAAVLRPPVLASGGAAALALALAIPETREIVFRIASGFWVLVVDFQAHSRPAWGLAEMADGTMRMHGMVKKALLQSMPYAAAVIVLLPCLWRGPDRAAVAFCALFVGLLLTPFAYGAWHGGMANNMRYFLNFLPVLAILAAATLRHLAAMPAGGRAVAPLAVLGVGGAAILYAAAREYPFEFAFQSTLPNALAAATAAAAGLVLVTRGALRGTFAASLRGLVAFGLLVAFISAWVFDVQIARQLRTRNATMVELTADLPRDALVITFAPAAAGFRVNRPPALTARSYLDENAVYPALGDLVARVFAEGRPVFAQGRHVAAMMVERGLAAGFEPRYGMTENHGYAERFELFEMKPPGERGSGAQ